MGDPERIIWNNGEYQEAAKRYQKLLDYYGIWPNVQAIAWESMLSLPPQQFIEEVNRYWKETFGKSGNDGNKNGNKTNDLQPPNLQKQPYQSSYKQRESCKNNKRK